ncbi:MAG: OmpA family protein [Crocinitomicaceae bacterium]|nr:OmpA family protein [Crocinitomicaceae bacterium]
MPELFSPPFLCAAFYLWKLAMRHYLTLVIFFLSAFVLSANGQNVTIVNHFKGDTTGRGLEGFRLSGSEQHSIIINYYEPAEKSDLDRLSELVGASLNFYIDQSVEISNGKIRLKRPQKEMIKEMNEIVQSAIKYYNFTEKENFNGFSKEIENKIGGLERLDFDSSPFATQASDAGSKKRLQYYFVQKELNDLKLMANLEVGNYSNTSLLVYAGSDAASIDAATRDSLLKLLEYDPGATLDPIQINYSQATKSMLSATDHSTLGALTTSANPHDFNEKVIQMLEQNNNRLETMQSQIDDLRAEQLRQFQAQQDKTNAQVQSQLDDLRAMIVELVKMNSGSAIASTGPEIFIDPNRGKGTVLNVPNLIDIYFPKGGTQLNTESKLALNEVVDILARNTSLNVVITGYADKTGSAVTNLLISQERAREVKKFMTASGLEASRFVTRYLGDSSSVSENANDRKVVLEFVTR